jgi:hypothetical protein
METMEEGTLLKHEEPNRFKSADTGSDRADPLIEK